MHCCKGSFGGQMSGACLADLPNPYTTFPTMTGGVLDFFYPDYNTAWSVGTCKNEAPLPCARKGDRPSYNTMIACSIGSVCCGHILTAKPT